MRPPRRIIDDTPAPEAVSAPVLRPRVFGMEGGPDPVGYDTDTQAVKAATAAAPHPFIQNARAAQQRRPAQAVRNENPPEVMAMLQNLLADRPNNTFLRSMHEQAAYRQLTPRQVSAIRNMTEERGRQAVTYRRIPEVINGAEHGQRSSIWLTPDLRIESAPRNGSNPGAVYVYLMDGMNSSAYPGGVYVGKILPSGEYMPQIGGDTLREIRRDLQHFNDDPLRAMEEFGVTTDCCALCGRGLDRHSSLTGSIGSVCLRKFGSTLLP